MCVAHGFETMNEAFSLLLCFVEYPVERTLYTISYNTSSLQIAQSKAAPLSSMLPRSPR